MIDGSNNRDKSPASPLQIQALPPKVIPKISYYGVYGHE